jgi:ABC-2 type transport system permease protein
MSSSLLPNAGIIARREYRERVRTRAFAISTAILALVALAASAAPIGLRAADQATVTRLAVTAQPEDLQGRTIAVLDSFLNTPPQGGDPAKFEKAYRVRPAGALEDELRALEQSRLDGLIVGRRAADGRLEYTYHSRDLDTAQRTQLVEFALIGASILDWQALSGAAGSGSFLQPAIDNETINLAQEGGQVIDQQLAASRRFLGIVFVILVFITLVIYGMWVASGVAAEKSNRVMELLIGAATPLQLLVGKVVGLGAAGLTQYLLIATPAVIVLFLQDRLSTAILGQSALSGAPLAGVTLPLLLAYGLFFLLGFAFYSLVYAAAGSLVSRQDDVQQLALPLSMVSMGGYLAAIAALGVPNAPWVVVMSFIPLFSPFVMLARVMVGRVEPWELALSVGILLVAIAGAFVVAARVYRAGVLLYGQRPGMRAFIAAARQG